MNNWNFTEVDRRIALELQSRLPDELFDAHAHLYRTADLAKPPGLLTEGPSEVGYEVWRQNVGQQVGAERLLGGLLFPFPSAGGDLTASNDFLFAQMKDRPMMKGLALISPDMSSADYTLLLDNPQFSGFKPYHVYSPSTPTFQAPLTSFLPEWAWQMAHDHSLALMLHIVRDDALADPDNLREIQQCCQTYPNARLILAHAGRGFHAPNTLKGIAGLRGLENVWFDTSGICEPEAFEAILREFGPRRLMWGTDHPVSEIRGRCVTVGDGFAWLSSDSVNWDKILPEVRPALVGLESLRALQLAMDTLSLNDSDRKDIYADNALRLLGLKTESETRTQDLYLRAKELIPGGTQLLSKRPEMMAPNQWPVYFREARGCETWDLDGKHYYDFSTNGIGSCLLGFCDPDVTRAVQRRIALGSMCTLNPPEEVELAEWLCEMHPWAEQARFARCGGEACAMAVRIARATTDRSVIAICGYHGWQDWYLAANLGESDGLRGHLLPGLNPLGVPRELRGTAATFAFNDGEAFQAVLDQYGASLAAVVMEPCRSQLPDPGFLEFVRDGAHGVGALFIMDEISIGFRLHCGGAHLKFGIEPDLAIFAKALGNGHPMAAVIGTRAAMTGAQESFISSTYWTEGVGPVAALATLRKMQSMDVPAHIERVGSRVQSQWRESAGRHGLSVVVGGLPCFASFRFDHPEADALRTLFTQMMLSRGFLAGAGLYPTLAHSDAIVDRYCEAIDSVFKEISGVLASGDEVSTHLCGPVAHSGFRRLAG